MEAKKEFFMKLLDDENLKPMLKQIKEFCESFDEGNDDVLDFLVGTMISFYHNPKNALLNLEILKYTLITMATGVSLDFASRIHDKDESKMPLV